MNGDLDKVCSGYRCPDVWRDACALHGLPAVNLPQDRLMYPGKVGPDCTLFEQRDIGFGEGMDGVEND